MPRAGGEDVSDNLGDDSDDLSSDDGDEDGEKEDGEEGGEGSGIEFAESDDDLLDSDAEIPEGLFDPDADSIAPSGDDEGEEEWGGVDAKPGQKRKTTKISTIARDDGGIGKEDRKKRRKIKHLPTFASMEDYEKLIDQSPEDNI